MRDYLCEQIGHDGTSIRVELLRSPSGGEEPQPTLIQALCEELTATWQAHSVLDKAYIADSSNTKDQLSKELDAKAKMIENLERAIASSRIQSPSDIEVVLLMFAGDLLQDWPDSLHRDVQFKLWSDTISEYKARDSADRSLDIYRYYSTRPAARQSQRRVFKDAAE